MDRGAEMLGAPSGFNHSCRGAYDWVFSKQQRVEEDGCNY